MRSRIFSNVRCCFTCCYSHSFKLLFNKNEEISDRIFSNHSNYKKIAEAPNSQQHLQSSQINIFTADSTQLLANIFLHLVKLETQTCDRHVESLRQNAWCSQHPFPSLTKHFQLYPILSILTQESDLDHCICGWRFRIVISTKDIALHVGQKVSFWCHQVDSLVTALSVSLPHVHNTPCKATLKVYCSL